MLLYKNMSTNTEKFNRIISKDWAMLSHFKLYAIDKKYFLSLYGLT